MKVTVILSAVLKVCILVLFIEEKLFRLIG